MNKVGKALAVVFGVFIWNGVVSLIAITVAPRDQGVATMVAMVLGMPGGALGVVLYLEWIEPNTWKAMRQRR